MNSSLDVAKSAYYASLKTAEDIYLAACADAYAAMELVQKSG